MLKKFRFETIDRDEAMAVMTELAGSVPTVAGRGGLTMKVATASTDDVTDSVVFHGEHIRSVNTPNDQIHVVTARMAYVIDAHGTEYSWAQGLTIRPPTHLPYRLSQPRGTLVVTSFPGSLVRDIARATFVDEPEALDLTSVWPVSIALERLWLAQMNAYRRHILQPEMDENPLIRREATRSLVTTAIVTFGLHRPAETNASASLAARRARQFIDENLQQPITVHDIATAARLSVRGLQYAFGHAFGTSPMIYLRSARLAGAHEQLLAADPTGGARVGDIAHRWGFVHLGRFAALYRETFGETPRQTLMR